MKAVIGIVGFGVVGSAVAAAFGEAGHPIVVYDKFKHMGSLADVIAKADMVFVCVPTLNYHDGRQDLRPLVDVLTRMSALHYMNPTVVKCSVVPGTMDKMRQQFRTMSLVHNPEFLTEKNAVNDFKDQKEILISSPDLAAAGFVMAVYHAAFPDAQVIMDSDFKTTELAKYIHNVTLATKVALMNEFYNHAQMIGANYDIAVQAAIGQGVIGESHTKVPGPDGKFGFGGMCFPKDTEALAYAAAGRMPILDAVIESNLKQRNK